MIRCFTKSNLCLTVLLCGHLFVPSALAWTPEILKPGSEHIYLPDWSFSGYRWGQRQPPEPVATVDVLAHGAVPDDDRDDTVAILAALKAAQREPGQAVLAFPSGRFILRDILSIERSHFVLRGAGDDPGGTVLEIPIALGDLRRPRSLDELADYLVLEDKREDGAPYSIYSWTGGFIWPQVPGKRGGVYLPELDPPPQILARGLTGLRGGHRVTVDTASRIDVGDQLSIDWYHSEGDRNALVRHLYMTEDVPVGPSHWRHAHEPLISQYVTIEAIDGEEVTIREPLLHDVRRSWSTHFSPSDLLTEIGIEGLRIEFPQSDYAGHHLERGYNAIYLSDLAHAWVRDVTIVDADNGILTSDVAQTTIEDISILGRPMHYGISIGDGSGVLARRLLIEAEALHTLAFNTQAKGSVFTDIDLVGDVHLDQHRGGNHQNLFDDIRVEGMPADPNLFKHGGSAAWRPTHAAFNTFWNIDLTFLPTVDKDRSVRLGRQSEGPHGRLIGFDADRDLSIRYGPHAYIEGTNRPGIGEPSLYSYQYRRRMQGR